PVSSRVFASIVASVILPRTVVGLLGATMHLSLEQHVAAHSADFAITRASLGSCHESAGARPWQSFLQAPFDRGSVPQRSSCVRALRVRTMVRRCRAASSRRTLLAPTRASV